MSETRGQVEGTLDGQAHRGIDRAEHGVPPSKASVASHGSNYTVPEFLPVTSADQSS